MDDHLLIFVIILAYMRQERSEYNTEGRVPRSVGVEQE